MTEFSLDRPQRSWPMQLEGLGSRLVGIGISENWQPCIQVRERWLSSENHILEEYRILLASTTVSTNSQANCIHVATVSTREEEWFR